MEARSQGFGPIRESASVFLFAWELENHKAHILLFLGLPPRSFGHTMEISGCWGNALCPTLLHVCPKSNGSGCFGKNPCQMNPWVFHSSVMNMNSSSGSALSHKPNLNLIWMQTQTLPLLKTCRNCEGKFWNFPWFVIVSVEQCVGKSSTSHGYWGPDEWKQLFALWVIPWKSSEAAL